MKLYYSLQHINRIGLYNYIYKFNQLKSLLQTSMNLEMTRRVKIYQVYFANKSTILRVITEQKIR
jgi:hypothetical protein